ncbi:hypothetical protein [Zhouia amylolytica]|nr:hypothetical protein [Zhouia amylolytica]
MTRNYSADNELRELDNYYPKSDLNHVYQKNRDQIINLLNTIEAVWNTSELDNEKFEILYEGLQNSWTAIFYDIIGKEINLMTGKINGVEKLIYNGIKDSKWRTRFNTVVIMKGFEQKKIKNEIIDLGLSDKSKKVREMALDVQNHWTD